MYVQATHHVYKGDIQKKPSRQSEDPHGHIFCVMTNQNACDHPQISHQGRQQIVENGLSY